jgi:hypothetical protein
VKIYKIIVLAILISLINLSHSWAEVNIETDQNSESYLISGQIILDETFSGAAITQEQAAVCEGCAWLVTNVCFVLDQNYVNTFCNAYTDCFTVENIEGQRKKIWRRLGFDEPWLLVGMMCIGPKGVNTPQKLTTTLSEKTIEYLPRLLPTTEPANDVLINLDVLFLSNQPNFFGPKNIIITGIPVTLSATPSWVWKFSDGTEIRTSNSGSGFPDGQIRHTFRRKGLQTISVTTTWNASWKTKSNIAIPVPGNSLNQTTVFTLIAHEAEGVLTR